MSSKKRTYEAPYHIQKINPGNANRRVRKKPPMPCHECKETSNCIKLFSNNINQIEKTIDNFFIDLPKKVEQPSMFNMKFTIILS